MSDPIADANMVLSTQGILLGMNNVVPQAELEFNEWYQRQHLSERLSVPGFKTVKRYQALCAAQKYLVVYECESVDVLQSQAYQERLANPTPWTQKIMPCFKDTSRTVLREEWVLGNGTGSVIALLHCAPVQGKMSEALLFVTQILAPQLVSAASTLRVALWRSDASVTGTSTTEMNLRGAPDSRADWVLCVEGVSDTEVSATIRQLSCLEQSQRYGLLIRSIDRYQFLCLRTAA